MRSIWRSAVPLIVWVVLASAPHPAGLTAPAWRYLALFAGVVAALVLEPIPPAAAGLVGVSFATVPRDAGEPEPRAGHGFRHAHLGRPAARSQRQRADRGYHRRAPARRRAGRTRSGRARHRAGLHLADQRTDPVAVG